MWPVDPSTYDASDGFRSMKPPRTYPHTGIDFIVPTGTPVYAVQPGVIVAALEDTGNGLCVAQSLPNGRYFSYIHLSQILVKSSQVVAEGQLVGLSGNTGTNSRGPHLHTSYSDSSLVYVGRGNLEDPYSYLQSLTPPTPPTPAQRKKKKMFSMAAIKGENRVWAVWAPGFYYEIKDRPGLTQAEVNYQMEKWNKQLIGSGNFWITRAQANDIKAMCLA